MDSSPAWIEILVAALSTLVVTFLVPFLRRKGLAAKAERDAHEASAANSTISARGLLVSRLQEFLYGSAAAIAEKRFPQLAEMIKAKRLNKDQIKKQLRSWGVDLKDDAYIYFGHQGIDLAKAVGNEWVNRMIERVANKVSPFPGRDTAKELLKSGVSKYLVDRGVNWVKEKYLRDDREGSAG